MMELCECHTFQCRSCDPHGYLLVSRLQKMANGSLLITDVTTDDTGKYTCVAGNSCSIKYRAVQLYVVGERSQHVRLHTHTHAHNRGSFISEDCAHVGESRAKDEDVH